jgi:hypothetical protein
VPERLAWATDSYQGTTLQVAEKVTFNLVCMQGMASVVPLRLFDFHLPRGL